MRPGAIDQRLKRVQDHLFGERTRGVMRAGVLARRGLHDNQPAGCDHDRAVS